MSLVAHACSADVARMLHTCFTCHPHDNAGSKDSKELGLQSAFGGGVVTPMAKFCTDIEYIETSSAVLFKLKNFGGLFGVGVGWVRLVKAR